MTDDQIGLTRRKILGGIGAVGAAGAGVGLGTSALFTDTESIANNTLTAGTLDMSVTAEIVAASEYYTEDGDGPNVIGKMDTADGSVVTGLQARDVKPGDWVIICFDIDVGDNPGYVRISTDDFAQYEDGQTEPEIAAEGDDGEDAGTLGGALDGQAAGELQDELVAEVYSEFDESSATDPPRSHLSDLHPNLSGSARTTYEQFGTGIVIGGSGSPTPVGSGEDAVSRYLLLELPRDVGNEIQSDAVEFDLVFESEQARNNAGFSPSSDLVGYWPLNSVEDGTAEDLSGNGNDGTVQGGVSSVSGQVANAGSFDGDDDQISVPDASVLDIQDEITISFWFALTGQSNDNQYPRAVSKGQSNTSNGAYGVFIEDAGGSPTRIGLRFIDTDGTRHDVDSGNSLPNYNDGEWHHVVAAYSNASDTGKLWLDGTKHVEETIPGEVRIRTTADDLHIGDGNGARHLNGTVDDVRIYDSALDDGEVMSIFNETN